MLSRAPHAPMLKLTPRCIPTRLSWQLYICVYIYIYGICPLIKNQLEKQMHHDRASTGVIWVVVLSWSSEGYIAAGTAKGTTISTTYHLGIIGNHEQALGIQVFVPTIYMQLSSKCSTSYSLPKGVLQRLPSFQEGSALGSILGGEGGGGRI